MKNWCLRALAVGAGWLVVVPLFFQVAHAATCVEVLSRFPYEVGTDSKLLSVPRWKLASVRGENSRKEFQVSGTVEFVRNSPDLRVRYDFQSVEDEASSIFVRFSSEKNLWAMQVNLAREESGEFTDLNLVRIAVEDAVKRVQGEERFVIRVNDPSLIKSLNEALNSELNFRGLEVKSGDDDFYDPRQFGFLRVETEEEALGLAEELNDTEVLKARLRAHAEMSSWNEILEGHKWELTPRFDVFEREEMVSSDRGAWDILVSYVIEIEREELYPH